MKILLDTHVWLWTLASPKRIAPKTLDLLSDTGNTLFLSAASTWEIAIKYRLGKLPLPEPPAQFIPPRISRDGITPLAVEHSHTLAVSDLPAHHNDPFDRLLVVQSQLEELVLVTHDAKLKPYLADIVWA